MELKGRERNTKKSLLDLDMLREQIREEGTITERMVVRVINKNNGVNMIQYLDLMKMTTIMMEYRIDMIMMITMMGYTMIIDKKTKTQ